MIWPRVTMEGKGCGLGLLVRLMIWTGITRGKGIWTGLTGWGDEMD